TDNGWITDPDTGRYAPKSKQSPYDGGLRTPILLRWPGKVPPGREETPVSSVDLLPTILAAAGVPVPEGLPGLDLRDLRAVRRRAAVSGACFTHDGVDLDRPASGLRWRWRVEGRWKLIAPAPWNEPDAKVELYDVVRDPFEETDLAAREPRRVRRMLRAVDAWWMP
ncbi:MAG: sulfatase-like hydrolase/transferase, partial [Verrucomicrobiales bacterium]|nr:sulfatase-like hydrolase/transferase [Verrucomicrobiales bacterium]